tara:strand:- start:1517 stop:2161 length:645 start_codon:yes stop_codon:yes gene_type:complete
MIKLKDILSEAYAWERQEGKPLPTLAEVQAAYQAKLREEAKPDFLDLDDDGDEEESMKSAANDADDDKDPEPEKWSKDKLEKAPEPYKYDPYGDDDDDDDYYMDEAAKPDFLDLDGDGNETESMKSAAADTTSHGNFINKSRAKSHLTKKDDHIYGHDSSGNVTKLNSPSDADNAKYKKFTIKSKDDLAESFNKRMLGNLHGHEYILREAFKRK